MDKKSKIWQDLTVIGFGLILLACLVYGILQFFNFNLKDKGEVIDESEEVAKRGMKNVVEYWEQAYNTHNNETII